MTSQKVFNLIDRIENISVKNGNSKGIPTLDQLMPMVTSAMDLGSGDIRRYGGLLPATEQLIEKTILELAIKGYFYEARARATDYKELERQESEQSTEVTA